MPFCDGKQDKKQKKSQQAITIINVNQEKNKRQITITWIKPLVSNYGVTIGAAVAIGVVPLVVDTAACWQLMVISDTVVFWLLPHIQTLSHSFRR